MSSLLQTWLVKTASGEEFEVDGVYSMGSYEGYVNFYDQNENLQGAFLYPEFYARISKLEDEWE